MVRSQSAALDRKKLMADPIMVTTIVVLITFLTLFILYPLAILLVDSFVGDGSFGFGIFERIFAMPTFTKAITNTLKVGFLVGILFYGYYAGTFSFTPDAKLLAAAGVGEEIVTAALDFSVLAEVRNSINVFHDRRPELYRL